MSTNIMSVPFYYLIPDLFYKRDAHTPQPGEIVFDSMRYRSSETLQISGYFQSSVSYIKVQIIFKWRK